MTNLSVSSPHCFILRYWLTVVAYFWLVVQLPLSNIHQPDCSLLRFMKPDAARAATSVASRNERIRTPQNGAKVEECLNLLGMGLEFRQMAYSAGS